MRLIADWLPHHHFTRGKGKRDAVVSLVLTTPSPAPSTPLRSPISLYFIPVIPVKNRALSEHEVCVSGSTRLVGRATTSPSLPQQQDIDEH